MSSRLVMELRRTTSYRVVKSLLASRIANQTIKSAALIVVLKLPPEPTLLLQTMLQAQHKLMVTHIEI